jgi:hypothetical protein
MTNTEKGGQTPFSRAHRLGVPKLVLSKRASDPLFRPILLLLLLTAAAHAEVSGVVLNGATGKPQSNQKVTLYKFGQGGMEPVTSVDTAADGKFTINQETGRQGPSMIRAEMDGVTYNMIIPPGQPSTGLALTIYPASAKPGAAKVTKHMLLFQPGGDQMVVNETILVDNSGKSTWVNPKDGTIHFYLPTGAKDLDVKASAPDGMPVPAPNDQVLPNVYAIKFEIKPGETRFDLSYSAPYKPGESYSGKIVTRDDNTYLIVPDGVTMQGDHLNDLSVEPRTKAHIFGLDGNAYSIVLTGTPTNPPAAAEGGPAAAQPEGAGPKIEEILPRILTQTPAIIGCVLAILALGFAILYRKEAR